MDLTPPPGTHPLDLKGKVLVVPAVAIGNVGQLAADLLITTLALPSRGLLPSPDLLPCLGLDAVNDGPAALAGPAQLYGREGDGWAVLHQRSPATPGRAAAHAAALAAWARGAGVSSLLILGSIDARARRGADLEGGGGGGGNGGPRAVVNRTVPPDHPLAAALAAKAASAAGCSPLADTPGDPPFAQGRLPPWPLLRECEGGAGAGGKGEASTSTSPAPLPALALLAFAVEGDNAGDAVSLATAAAGVLGVGVPDGGWVAPRAWAALYGGGGGV